MVVRMDRKVQLLMRWYRPLWCLLSGLSVSVEGVSANGYEGDGDYRESVPFIWSRLRRI